MSKHLFLLAVILTMVASVSSAKGELVARILQVNGKVAVLDQQGKKRTAEVFGALALDETVSLPDDSSVVLGWLVSGRVDRLSTKGTFKITADGLDAATKENAKQIPVPKKRQQLMIKGLKDLPSISPGGVTVARGGNIDPEIPPTLPHSWKKDRRSDTRVFLAPISQSY